MTDDICKKIIEIAGKDATITTNDTETTISIKKSKPKYSHTLQTTGRLDFITYHKKEIDREYYPNASRNCIIVREYHSGKLFSTSSYTTSLTPTSVTCYANDVVCRTTELTEYNSIRSSYEYTATGKFKSRSVLVNGKCFLEIISDGIGTSEIWNIENITIQINYVNDKFSDFTLKKKPTQWW